MSVTSKNVRHVSSGHARSSGRRQSHCVLRGDGIPQAWCVANSTDTTILQAPTVYRTIALSTIKENDGLLKFQRFIASALEHVRD